jgi:hypothetical protein
MLVDEAGRFLTQRQLPRMALIDTQLRADALIVRAASMPDLTVPLQADAGQAIQTQIWQDSAPAYSAGNEAAAWLSEFLSTPVRLVSFPADHLRQVDETYAKKGDGTAFSDGFPFLLISQASLDELNSRLPEPVPMRRFRPNLVVSGTEAFAEDRWRRIRIGALSFRVVKPCSRCVITTIDPQTAKKGVEPLRTLATYRRQDGKVCFGQNLIHDGLGSLKIGDQVEVLESSDG